MNTRAPNRRYDTVQQDWRAILPFAKGTFFANQTEQLESAYLMFSVSLDEAMSLHQAGDEEKSRLGLPVVGELCSSLAVRINAVLHSMRQFARHFGVVPNLALLEIANFRSARGQRCVRHSNLVNHVLLSERSQFLNKLSTLEEIVDELCDEFTQYVERLASGPAWGPAQIWLGLDSSHFDLNTCLRETDILLKSFLLVLPEDQLNRFDFTISGLARARRKKVPAGSSELVQPRRITAVAGE